MENKGNRVKRMTTKRGKDKKKREAQVNVRLTPEFYKRLQKACELNEHKEGQLCRILIEWALPFYERTESVKTFKAIVEPKIEAVPIRPATVNAEDIFNDLQNVARQVPSEKEERSA